MHRSIFERSRFFRPRFPSFVLYKGTKSTNRGFSLSFSGFVVEKRRIDSDNFYLTVLSPLPFRPYGRRRPTGSSEGHRRGRVRPSDPFAPARSDLSLSAAIFRSGALLVDSRVRVGHLERLNGVYRHPNSIRISDTPRAPRVPFCSPTCRGKILSSPPFRHIANGPVR